MALAAAQIPFEVLSAEDHADAMVFEIVGLSTLLTDLNTGGIARSICEALGIELEKLDAKMFFGIQRAIPVILYTALNFPRLSPVKATGIVTFTRVPATTGDITIPIGTKLTAPATPQGPAVSFSTLSAAILKNKYGAVNVAVAADAGGSGGNISAGRITVIQVPIGNVQSVYNHAAIKNGRDEETEEERLVRFRKYVINLARSPLAGIESGAGTAQLVDVGGIVVERVAKALAIEPENTIGQVSVYIDNGGGTASDDLVAEAQRIVDGYRDVNGNLVVGYKAGGIKAKVSAIESIIVPVTLELTIASGFTFDAVKTDVIDVIEDFFLNLEPGAPLIFVDLSVVVAETPGVYDVQFVTPTANMNVAQTQRLLSGAITIVEAV